MKTKSIGPILLACSLLLFLQPVAAIADDAFDSLSVASYATRHTQASPEHLAACIQPVDQRLAEDSLEIHVIDAVLVESVLAIAWTVKNAGDIPLYMVDEVSIDEYGVGGYYYHGIGGILEPGETWNCGVAGYLDEREYQMLEGDTQKIILSVAGLRILGETMDWSEVGKGTLYAHDRQAYNAEVDRLFAEEGKIVMEGGGYMSPGSDSSYSREEWMEPPYAMYPYISSGRLSVDSHIRMELPLRLDREMQSILPEKVETPYGEGSMRLTRADFSPARLFIEADYVFKDEQAAYAFHDPENYEEAPPFAIVDSRGVQAFCSMGSLGFVDEYDGMQTQPKQTDDGAFVWTYRSEHILLSPLSSEYYILWDTSILPESWLSFENPVTAFSDCLMLQSPDTEAAS